MSENSNNENLATKQNYFFKIIVTETLAVIFVLLTVLTVKLFFKKEFSALKVWYCDNLLSDTSVSEVLDA
ncbi:MAG: hypothetical protein E7562_04605 [Ruminococcaceae bacterium]|nr:hypothetical protein [Oscillospiraceae bacterium]